jgi:hypothetical protein
MSMSEIRCGDCFAKIYRWKWKDNQRLCEKCFHSKIPLSVRMHEVERKPTFEDLKKKWEAKRFE